MSALSLVTGASSGVGKALALALAFRGQQVLIVGRRAHLLEEVVKTARALGASGSVVAVPADLTTESGRTTVADAVAAAAAGKPLQFLVQNAAVIGPITTAEKTDLGEFRATMEANLVAPLALVQKLSPHLGAGSRILHISSGAANSAFPGWTSYCCSKAAFSMLWRVLAVELKDRGISVGSARPGVVDTQMQTEIRSADPAGFPIKQRFDSLFEGRKMYDSSSASSSADASAAADASSGVRVDCKGSAPPSDALDTVENVAIFLRWLLMDTSAEEFTKAEWDSRDATHQGRWTGVAFRG
jgi:benzil reductase ((S)-benzoin forming)